MRMTEERLAQIRAALATAEAARPLLHEDFPVGAKPRADWRKARNELADAAPDLLAHIDALQRWKDEALEVDRGWDVQAIGRLIGAKVGTRILPQIQPAIESLMKLRAALQPFADLFTEEGRAPFKRDSIDPCTTQGLRFEHSNDEALIPLLIRVGDIRAAKEALEP